MHARKHINTKLTIHTDIKDFFPSTSANRLVEAIHANDQLYRFIGESNLEWLIKLIAPEGGLAQGFPTSPIFSTVAFAPCDKAIERITTGFIYTRYADDIFISAKTCRARNTLFKMVHGIARVAREYSYRINKGKTYIMHADRNRYITGYRVTYTKITPTAATKERVWNLLKDAERELSDGERDKAHKLFQQAAGLTAFCVAPGQFHLSKKGSEIARKLSKELGIKLAARLVLRT